MFNKSHSLQMSGEDIARTYNDDFIGWRQHDGTVVPIRVLHEHRRNRIRLDGQDLVPLDDPRLVLEHPDSGYAIIGGQLIYVQRVAQRQWHRCLRQRCIITLECSTSRQANLSVDSIAPWMYKEAFPITENGNTIHGRKFAEDSEGNVFLHGRCVKSGDAWSSPLIEQLFNEVKESL